MPTLKTTLTAFVAALLMLEAACTPGKPPAPPPEPAEPAQHTPIGPTEPLAPVTPPEPASPPKESALEEAAAKTAEEPVPEPPAVTIEEPVAKPGPLAITPAAPAPTALPPAPQAIEPVDEQAGAVAGTTAEDDENDVPGYEGLRFEKPPEAQGPTHADLRSVSYLRPGEVLEFKLGWGLLSHIGETWIKTESIAEDGAPSFKISTVTQTRGLIDAVYPIYTDSTTVIDRATALPLTIAVEGKTGKRPSKTLTVFNHSTGDIVHTDYERPARSGTAQMPPDPVYDITVAMLKAREWGMKPGETRNFLTSFEDDFYYLAMKAVKREKIRTKAGTFQAVLIEPTPIGEPKGLFRKGGAMKFWVSDGPDPQIVKIVFKLKVGTITGVLESVTKDSDAADAAGS